MMTLQYILMLLVIFNPILVTPLAVVLGLWGLYRSPLRHFRRRILIGLTAALAVYFIVDSTFAYRRVAYARQLATIPVVYRRIPLPSSVVLVGMTCDLSCLKRLVDGTFSDVVVLHDPFSLYLSQSPMRYSIRRDAPVDCPTQMVERAERQWDKATIKALQDRAVCPMIEECAAPSEGVFVVRESAIAITERATAFSPEYIVARPPSAVIQFSAVEVQRRSSAGAEVLAEARYYAAAGYLGPLVGCWERPDTIIWIMPAGDTGCGVWRRIVDGGDRLNAYDPAWVFSDLLTDRT